MRDTAKQAERQLTGTHPAEAAYRDRVEPVF
jgi:hypothetical protein